MAFDKTKLFDFINVFFTNEKEYEKLNDADKARHFFMLNRFMSIMYPINANMFNKNGINTAAVVDCWHLVARKYKRTPGWFYTKLNKNASEKASSFSIEDEVLDKYLEINKIGIREYKEALRFNKDSVIAELKELKKQMSVNGNKK